MEGSRSRGPFWAIRDLADDEDLSEPDEDEEATTSGDVPLPTIGDDWGSPSPGQGPMWIASEAQR
jgi:hypothetical protein